MRSEMFLSVVGDSIFAASECVSVNMGDSALAVARTDEML